MVRCRSKNGHQEGILCLKEIGLRAAQNFLTIIGSIIQGGEKGGGEPMWPSYDGSLSVDLDNSLQFKISSKTFWD